MDRQCVVVTGSTRGLGFALAGAFLREGCAVMVSGRDEHSVVESVDKLRSSHAAARVEGTAANVAHFEDVE